MRQLGLAGAFIWSVELDDFAGVCNQGKYPLLSTIARVLRSDDQRSAGDVDGGFSRYGSDLKASHEARHYDSPPPVTTSPSRLHRGRSEARRGFSPDGDDHSRSRNFRTYEKASEYGDHYQDGEDTQRADGSLKAATSYGDSRGEALHNKYLPTSHKAYGDMSLRHHLSHTESTGTTKRRVGSSRY